MPSNIQQVLLSLKSGSPIDIGAGATNRADTTGAFATWINTANPANATGKITSVELWFSADATGVKVATFSGSGTSYTPRSVTSIGNVTSGSKQTFAVDLDVQAGDFIGCYWATGSLETDPSGGTGNLYYKNGDQTAAGTQTYTLVAGRDMSMYGTGTT